MRLVRLCARALRLGLWHLPVPGLAAAPGWAAYRARRVGR